MVKLPKHIYIHWFLMIAIFTALITALLTYVLVTAPIEHNQRQIVEVINLLLKECTFVQNSDPYQTLYNLSLNINATLK